MAGLAAQGSWRPAFITMAIAVILGLWSAYALSGAGVLPRLPLLKVALIAITSVYLLRGIAGFMLAAFAPGENTPVFWVWSSAICLLIGVVHAIGVRGVWSSLSGVQT